MPTSVALSSHFETFVREQVESGRYNNASEVVRAGLRLLEDQQHGHVAHHVERAPDRAGPDGLVDHGCCISLSAIA